MSAAATGVPESAASVKARAKSGSFIGEGEDIHRNEGRKASGCGLEKASPSPDDLKLSAWFYSPEVIGGGQLIEEQRLVTSTIDWF